MLEHYLRQPGEAWPYTRHSGLEAVLALPSLEAELDLGEVYSNVAFPA